MKYNKRKVWDFILLMLAVFCLCLEIWIIYHGLQFLH